MNTDTYSIEEIKHWGERDLPNESTEVHLFIADKITEMVMGKDAQKRIYRSLVIARKIGNFFRKIGILGKSQIG